MIHSIIRRHQSQFGDEFIEVAQECEYSNPYLRVRGQRLLAPQPLEVRSPPVPRRVLHVEEHTVDHHAQVVEALLLQEELCARALDGHAKVYQLLELAPELMILI